MTFLALSAFLISCAEPEGDALAAVDSRYAAILTELAAAERDTTRNVHNSHARQRKVDAEAKRLAFFGEAEVRAAIEKARAAPAGSSLAVRGAVYADQVTLATAWTAADRAEEERLLGLLDEGSSVERSWQNSDGTVGIPLGSAWDETSKPADLLDEAGRASLADAFCAGRTAVVAEHLIALVKLRNGVAKRAGHDSYWSFALATQGLDPAAVTALSGELGGLVTPLHTAEMQRVGEAAAAAGMADTFANHPLLRRKAGLEKGRDEADGAFDADLAEQRILTMYGDMGFDMGSVQLYTGSKRVVRPGVYGYAIKPPAVAAVVMSNDERWSVWPYEALAHEMGHAVWWLNLGPEAAASPATWEPRAYAFEGFAQFFEHAVFEPSFAAKYVPDLAEPLRAELYDWRRRQVAASITDAVVTSRAEQQLYEHPDDLAAAMRLAATTRAELTGAPAPLPGPAGDVYDPALLSGLLWHYPAYSPNYLYAYVIEAQIWAAVRASTGDPVGNPAVAPLLADKLVRAAVTTSFDDRLAALWPGDRTAPLRDYLAPASGGTPAPEGAVPAVTDAPQTP